MRNMKKQVLLFMMALLPIVVWADDSGTIDGISWFYEESTGTLTLSGTGNMPDFYYVARPWDTYRSYIRKVVIGDGITSIGPRAFYEFFKIESIVGGENLTSIGKYAFYNCAKLSSIPLWPNVGSFGNYAFYGCSGLKSISLGPKVYELGEYMFYNTKITSISIPSSLYCIGDKCFTNCAALDTVYIENLAKWCNMLFITDKSIASSNPLSYAKHAFVDGQEITDFIIPNEATKISPHSFNNFEGISSVSTGDGVTVIGEGAFRGTPLSTVVLGKNVKSIEYNAFTNCNQLKDVYVNAETVPSAWPDDDDDHDGSFQYTDIGSAVLHVPASAIEEYKSKAPWKYFGKIYAIGYEPLPQCATPTIAYANGKVKFACETEGVEFVPSITVTPNQLQNGNELAIGGNFTVSVYAVKEGYDNSDTATMTINMSQIGDVNADGELNAADITAVVNAILGK